jgi:hypothetical protein
MMPASGADPDVPVATQRDDEEPEVVISERKILHRVYGALRTRSNILRCEQTETQTLADHNAPVTASGPICERASDLSTGVIHLPLWSIWKCRA